jgi:hypothetical protein
MRLRELLGMDQTPWLINKKQSETSPDVVVVGTL